MGLPSSSAGKESACSAGYPGWTPGLGRSTGEEIGFPTPVFLGFPGGSAGKESACNVGDLSLIPMLGKPLKREQLSTSVFWAGEFHGL